MWEFWEVIHFSSLQRQRRHCRGVERVHRCACVRERERARGRACVFVRLSERSRAHSILLPPQTHQHFCFFSFFTLLSLDFLLKSGWFCWSRGTFRTFPLLCECVCGDALGDLWVFLCSRGGSGGRHCTGDRTACRSLLLPLGWWVTMMWRDLYPPPPSPLPSLPLSLLFLSPSLLPVLLDIELFHCWVRHCRNPS